MAHYAPDKEAACADTFTTESRSSPSLSFFLRMLIHLDPDSAGMHSNFPELPIDTDTFEVRYILSKQRFQLTQTPVHSGCERMGAN